MLIEINHNSEIQQPNRLGSDDKPILIVPYMWIGDFVRCHSVVQVLRQRFPGRPVDMLATTLCAPLADYMPGVRQAVVADLPRMRLALAERTKLAGRLRREGYGTALIMPRTWKAALAPFLAGIPERTGFVGEARFILLNDLRRGERALPRMVDRCAALALPSGADLPAAWPQPALEVPGAEIAAWQERRGLAAETSRPVVALAPGAVGPSKRWPSASYALLARHLLAAGLRSGCWAAPTKSLWRRRSSAIRQSVTSPAPTCATLFSHWPARAVAISNNSGLLHVSAALGCRRSAFSARPAPGTGRRSIRWRRRSRPRANSPAGPATSRYAASATTAACARSLPRRFLRRPATRSRRRPPPAESGRQPACVRHNAAFIKSE